MEAKGSEIEALQGGLGDEDFSEVWKLMDSLVNGTESSSTVGAGITSGSSTEGGSGGSIFDFIQLGSSPAPSGQGEDDTAVLAAQNLEALLKGCVV